jgi:DNA-binding NarL/FixJ family response regulator
MITIVLADDHKIFRQTLGDLLEAESDFRVVGEASDGFEAVRLIGHLKPDILVTDLLMPGRNGIEVTKQARKISPKTAVIILSMHSDEAYVVGALDAGAKGYVIKESGIGELVHAIREAVAGRCHLSPPISEHDLEAYREMATNTEMEIPF